MDKKSASSLIKDTFQQPFDKERFVHFVKNLVNDIDETKALVCQGQYIHEKFRDFVKKYERIGTYTDPSDQKVDILIVYLKNEGTLARARTSQRNFISTYLKSRDAKDAGLIAFVSPNPEDWRFSFVKMEYRLAEKKGKVRAEEEFTPARRYSFLVGRHESSHTAQQQLLPILSDDQHNPTLEIIENAFKIETVTKEFFEKYRGLFWEVKDALDTLVKGNDALRKEFEAKGVGTADFAKKLLGQIVFLHFLQKKGWFGVDRDAVWGSGHKNFLRQLFEGKLMKYKNFFNDVLEPLFYEALAVEREDNFYSKFNCKIPFLNGGLFDPINSYDWIHTDITLPNELFSNDVKTVEEDVGTGILDIFDRYNFTVKEDEPLEKEVAVDPEMLGKVFENLLEVNDRKSKGTYYTPREIVHYMCQESLINYLATELKGIASKEDIQLFIRMGETVIEHDARVIQRGEENSAYSFKLPESIRKNAGVIDQKLATIRVCDPAIGSGAFPVGMMNEIVRARQTLSSYLPKSSERLPYDLKRHAIQESLYGVDIDPGAVEIAKLRLWLSLIVDEDDIERIKPLPNLDYRIMQGNSLLEEFEGIRLFDDKLLESNVEDREKQLAEAKKKITDLQHVYFDLHSSGKLTDTRGKEIQTEIKRQQSLQKQLQEKPIQSENIGMFDAPSRAGEVLKELKSLHSAFFSATQRKKKDEIKKKIEALDWELIEISLTEKKKGELLEKLKRTRVRPFFLWKLHFADVFREKGGFDVVIANPPYIRLKELKAASPDSIRYFAKKYRSAAKGNYDIYVLFVEKGLELLTKKGHLSYILPHKFFNAKYGEPLREIIASGKHIKEIVHFGDQQIFDGATTYTCLLFLSGLPNDQSLISKVNHIESWFSTKEAEEVTIPASAISKSEWNFNTGASALLLGKLDAISTKLSDVADRIAQGIRTSANEVYVLESLSQKEGITTAFSKNLNKEVQVETSVLHKFLQGKEIKPYQVLPTGKVVIVPYRPEGSKSILIPENELKEKYAMTYQYLLENKEYLQNRERGKMSGANWYGYIYPKNIEVMQSKKILVPDIADRSSFAYDENAEYAFTSGYGIILKIDVIESPLYYLGLLNCRLIDFYLKSISTTLRGGFFRYFTQYLEKIPIKVPSPHQHENVATQVSQLLELKKESKDTRFVEAQIDKLFYEIYGLTNEEIAILEASIA